MSTSTHIQRIAIQKAMIEQERASNLALQEKLKNGRKAHGHSRTLAIPEPTKEVTPTSVFPSPPPPGSLPTGHSGSGGSTRPPKPLASGSGGGAGLPPVSRVKAGSGSSSGSGGHASIAKPPGLMPVNPNLPEVAWSPMHIPAPSLSPFSSPSPSHGEVERLRGENKRQAEEIQRLRLQLFQSRHGFQQREQSLMRDCDELYRTLEETIKERDRLLILYRKIQERIETITRQNAELLRTVKIVNASASGVSSVSSEASGAGASTSSGGLSSAAVRPRWRT